MFVDLWGDEPLNTASLTHCPNNQAEWAHKPDNPLVNTTLILGCHGLQLKVQCLKNDIFCRKRCSKPCTYSLSVLPVSVYLNTYLC